MIKKLNDGANSFLMSLT